MKNESQDKEKSDLTNSDELLSPDKEKKDREHVSKPMNNISRPYMRDDLFKELMTHYQNADWESSLDSIERLTKLYPGESSLEDFREDILMRSRLYQKGSQSKKVENRLRIRQTSGWIIVGVIVVLTLIVVSRLGITRYQEQRATELAIIEATNQAISIQTKYKNANSYLQADRPEEAMRLYEEIDQLSPGYAEIDQKMVEAQEGIRLKELYQQAVAHIEKGELDAALQILRDLNEQKPNYRDVPQLIESVTRLQEIKQLEQEMAAAFDAENWAGVIDGYEQIRSIDPTYELAGLEEKLFISYMNRIIEIADRPDALLEDVELAESYYRAALALFPQSREFADERAELEQVATNLLVNKFHIHAVTLMETERYSIESLQQASRILSRANSINPDLPVITGELSTVQAYIVAFNHYVNRRYDQAITAFTNLQRSEPDYGGGRINYMLYEAHIARGDLFLAYGDFANALDDYEAAEKFAWEEDAGQLQLFEVEIRIGKALRKLSLFLESSEYFHFAANLVGIKEFIDPNQVEVLQAFNEAQVAYLRGQSWEASRLYDFVYEEASYIFPYETIRVSRGEPLVDFSFLFGSTIDSVREFNSLGDAMESRLDQDLLMPNLEEQE